MKSIKYLFPKTNRVKFIVSTLFLLSQTINAQNASTSGNAPAVGGVNSSAFGDQSLFNAGTGANDNSAIGNSALYTLTSGDNNVAAGRLALYLNNGDGNCGVGESALYSNTTGNGNTANGTSALLLNSTGEENSAFGADALYTNTSGDYNTAVGWSSGPSNSNNSYQTAIGALAVTYQNNMIRLGSPLVTLLECQVALTTLSDRRFKYELNKSGVKGLSFINNLRPVAYNLDTRKHAEMLSAKMPERIKNNYANQDYSASMAIRRSGFIAQEVEIAANQSGYNFSALQKPNTEDGFYGLAYEEFVVPLVKAVQEQQTMIDDKKARIADLISNATNEVKTTMDDKSEKANIQISTKNNGRNIGVRYQIFSDIDGNFLAIYDLTGKQIKSLELENRQGEIEIAITNEFGAGLYNCMIVSNESILVSNPIVVE